MAVTCTDGTDSTGRPWSEACSTTGRDGPHTSPWRIRELWIASIEAERQLCAVRVAAPMKEAVVRAREQKGIGEVACCRRQPSNP